MGAGKDGIRGTMAGLYDVFVDWKGRLGREMPGLAARLRAAGAERVLDAGCGTGRHVGALLEAGFDARGADVSEDMLAQARALTGAPERFFGWRMGEAPPVDLVAAGPFDAIVCLGNVWPQLLPAAAVDGTLHAFRALLKPGGLALVGLKAVAVRKGTKNPYMPLLKRTHEGKALFFVRFVDFDLPPSDEDGTELCDFHMVVVGEDEGGVHHRAHRIRVWDPPALEAAFRTAGFAEVHVSATLADPHAAPTTEDVFVHALR